MLVGISPKLMVVAGWSFTVSTSIGDSLARFAGCSGRSPVCVRTLFSSSKNFSIISGGASCRLSELFAARLRAKSVLWRR